VFFLESGFFWFDVGRTDFKKVLTLEPVNAEAKEAIKELQEVSCNLLFIIFFVMADAAAAAAGCSWPDRRRRTNTRNSTRLPPPPHT
jgi:hypothetical protein